MEQKQDGVVSEVLCACKRLTHKICMDWFSVGVPACSLCIHFKKLEKKEKNAD